MSKIDTVYFISHTHTDIGYTDHQDTVFRQHLEFIDQAIELGEATADFPEDARYKWTCEVTSMVERYFRERPARQIDRFLELHRRGQMAVAAMQYHWTPMLSSAGMIRSLFPIARLRKNFGLNITTAMQCDVNGASWLWADLLPAVGVDTLTMSINMHRGRRPVPDLNAFWWHGPGGGKLMTYNGPHYLYGIFRYGIGDEQMVETLLPQELAKLEKRSDYPYHFVYGQVTHPARVDNGPPLPNLSEFVQKWNKAGRAPRMQFITVDQFAKMMRERYGAQLVDWSGDWCDWWADGVGSSMYETSLNRSTEELLPALDLLATQTTGMDAALVEEAYHLVSLYDEHTWGGFASVRRPHSPFTRANYNRKASFAFGGYGLTHELLASGSRAFAAQVAQVQPEGEKWRRWGQYLSADPSADPTANHFLVLNTLPWTRHVRWAVPPDMGGAAPYGSLEMFLVDNYRERPPLESEIPPKLVIDATLPPFGYQVMPYHNLGEPDQAMVGDGIVENRWYRIELDPATGGLRSWYDKELKRELASQTGPWRLGQYVYEWIDDPKDRDALWAVDYSREDFGVRLTNTPFRRTGASAVSVMPTQRKPDGVVIEARLQAAGARSVKVRYTLPYHEKALHVDMVVDKEFRTQAEAVYVTFPFGLAKAQFHLDLNGVPLEPEAEQLPGSCRDYYGVHRWAEVNDGEVSVTLATLDSPLIQCGGIATGRWAQHLSATEPTLVSWAMHNHWDTNFKASQGEDTLLRYRLTSRSGYDSAASSRFAMEATIPPIIVRVPGANTAVSGQFMQVSPEGVAEIQLKRAADGRGLIVHAYNLTSISQEVKLSFTGMPVTGMLTCSPIEEDGDSLSFVAGHATLSVPARSVSCARVLMA